MKNGAKIRTARGENKFWSGAKISIGAKISSDLGRK